VTRVALTAFAVLLTAGALLVSISADHAGADPAPLLPDLAQTAPRDIVIGRVTKLQRENGNDRTVTAVRIAFTSEVVNVGKGPLIVRGVRGHNKKRTMRADQLVKMDNGQFRVIKGVSRWTYVANPDHSHWHYHGFDAFRLVGMDGKIAARSTKQGFCLGDRSKGDLTLPGAPQRPLYTGHCALKKPNARTVKGGISVGWGDDYAAFLEGQSIDVTRVPAGRYCLEHRATGSLREVGSGNNLAVAIVTIDPAARPATLKVDSTMDFLTNPAPSCAAAAALPAA
jgi:hypothetical protein